ncbi:MAG: carboxypeptidase regulatory-like domain-containing protein [Anaerolineae bacterium]
MNRARRSFWIAWALGMLVECSAVAALEAGDITGTVRLVGKSVPPKILHLTADYAVCGHERQPSKALLLSPSREVKNAVVFIADERMEGWRAATTFQMDQRRCTFIPRVLIVPPGATVEVLNSDGILHNFHTRSRLNPSVNLGQPAGAKPLRLTFEHPEIVQVNCDIHGKGFMRGWIVVANHPYYALTDEEGRFRIPDVPVGPHSLEVWHELLGRKRKPVTVGVSGELDVTLTFTTVERKR